MELRVKVGFWKRGTPYVAGAVVVKPSWGNVLVVVSEGGIHDVFPSSSNRLGAADSGSVVVLGSAFHVSRGISPMVPCERADLFRRRLGRCFCVYADSVSAMANGSALWVQRLFRQRAYCRSATQPLDGSRSELKLGCSATKDTGKYHDVQFSSLAVLRRGYRAHKEGSFVVCATTAFLWQSLYTRNVSGTCAANSAY